MARIAGSVVATWVSGQRAVQRGAADGDDRDAVGDQVQTADQDRPLHVLAAAVPDRAEAGRPLADIALHQPVMQPEDAQLLRAHRACRGRTGSSPGAAPRCCPTRRRSRARSGDRRTTPAGAVTATSMAATHQENITPTITAEPISVIRLASSHGSWLMPWARWNPPLPFARSCTSRTSESSRCVTRRGRSSGSVMPVPIARTSAGVHDQRGDLLDRRRQAVDDEDRQQPPEQPAELCQRHRIRGVRRSHPEPPRRPAGEQRDRHPQQRAEDSETHRQKGAPRCNPHAVAKQSQHSTDRNGDHRQKHPSFRPGPQSSGLLSSDDVEPGWGVMAGLLVETKLYRPRSREGLVASAAARRPPAAQGRHRAHAGVRPAGFGKTTLVSSWAGRRRGVGLAGGERPRSRHLLDVRPDRARSRRTGRRRRRPGGAPVRVPTPIETILAGVLNELSVLPGESTSSSTTITSPTASRSVAA